MVTHPHLHRFDMKKPLVTNPKPTMSKTDPFATNPLHKMQSGVALLNRFIPYPDNPRTHPPAEIMLLSQLLKTRGVDQPIVVDENWIILKGHGRLQAASLAGLKQFPYVQRFGLSEVDKRAIRIEDNQVALLAGWDRALIRTEIGQLQASGYDIALLGFGEAEIVSFTKLPGPPASFQAFDETIETQFCCPKCKFEWSGNPMMGKKKEGGDTKGRK